MSKEISINSEQLQYLLSPKAIRDRALKVRELTIAGRGHFKLDLGRLEWTTEYVLQTIKKNYPSLEIPFHSRRGHFKAGQINRIQQFKELAGSDKVEAARSELDLVITSVLLDAGAGTSWSYFEETTKKTFNRSEGLGVASYYMFTSGCMSSDRKSLRADSEGLKALTENDIKTHFQVSEKNPLIGVQGRLALLKNLGQAVENKKIFQGGRPGNILDYLVGRCGKTIPATEILAAVLEGFGSIWPGRLSAQGVNLGDVWKHEKLGTDIFDQLVPLHKLSQWMTYSLIEPIEDAGFKVTHVEDLTGLAEYRNGGLMIDSGLLSFQNSEDAGKLFNPDNELIIEWRALTVHLLDLIGENVQKSFGFSPQQFPLAKVLEGGTWWAGRFLAQEKRAGGVPPININSDGTVF